MDGVLQTHSDETSEKEEGTYSTIPVHHYV